MFCIQCGANVDNAIFCPVCGAKVTVQPADMNSVLNRGGFSGDAGQGSASKGISIKLVVLAVSVFVVVVAAVITVWLLKAGKEDTAVSDSDTTGMTSEERKETEAVTGPDSDTEEIATEDKTEEKVTEAEVAAAEVDWKTMYWEYIEENKLLKLRTRDGGYDKFTWWYLPGSIKAKDCNLDGIPEIYLLVREGLYGSDQVGSKCIILNIENEALVRTDSVGSFENGIECAGCSWEDIDCLSENAPEKYPDNIKEIKEYIEKDEFEIADFNQKSQMAVSGCYEQYGKQQNFSKLEVGYVDGCCYFWFRDQGISVYGTLEADGTGKITGYRHIGPDTRRMTAEYSFTDDKLILRDVKVYESDMYNMGQSEDVVVYNADEIEYSKVER